MDTKPKVRFAPSPSGELHVGGARTALFNWLLTRHSSGKFILRIEDTDQTRSTKNSIKAIKRSLKWLGLNWDQYYCQTERFDLYQEAAEKLRAKGKAYEQEGALWFSVPKTGSTTVCDQILGEVTYRNLELKDFVIRRSDGSFIYNFACVVDDADLGITHVIRGDEHLNNTPKQILVYGALGEKLPNFAHLPMILAKDRSKLSKRHGAISTLEYKRRGYLPEALVNFLARLGWSYGDQEIFTKEELIEHFTLENVGKSAAVFDEDKLLWLNHHYIKEADEKRMANLLIEYMIQEGVVSESEASKLEKNYLVKLVGLFKKRSRTLVEMADWTDFLFADHIDYEPELAEKYLRPEKADLLKGLIKKLEKLDKYANEEIEQAVRAYLEEKGKSLGTIAQTCRVALTGKTVGAGLFRTMEILGRDKVLQRLKKAVCKMK